MRDQTRRPGGSAYAAGDRGTSSAWLTASASPQRPRDGHSSRLIIEAYLWFLFSALRPQHSALSLERSRCMAKGAAVLAELLAEAGVRQVFGIPSGPWCPFMEAMRTGEV